MAETQFSGYSASQIVPSHMESKCRRIEMGNRNKSLCCTLHRLSPSCMDVNLKGGCCPLLLSALPWQGSCYSASQSWEVVAGKR